MKYALTFALLLVLTPCFSQNAPITAYHYKEKGLNFILLLSSNTGYSYSGPHLFIDEVFTYEIRGGQMIRIFDPEYALHRRKDTLTINKRSLQHSNGFLYKKVSSGRRDKLIRKYIQPSAEVGFYRIFLEKVSSGLESNLQKKELCQ